MGSEWSLQTCQLHTVNWIHVYWCIRDHCKRIAPRKLEYTPFPHNFKVAVNKLVLPRFTFANLFSFQYQKYVLNGRTFELRFQESHVRKKNQPKVDRAKGRERFASTLAIYHSLDQTWDWRTCFTTLIKTTVRSYVSKRSLNIVTIVCRRQNVPKMHITIEHCDVSGHSYISMLSLPRNLSTDNEMSCKFVTNCFCCCIVIRFTNSCLVAYTVDVQTVVCFFRWIMLCANMNIWLFS